MLCYGHFSASTILEKDSCFVQPHFHTQCYLWYLTWQILHSLPLCVEAREQKRTVARDVLLGSHRMNCYTKILNLIGWPSLPIALYFQIVDGISRGQAAGLNAEANVNDWAGVSHVMRAVWSEPEQLSTHHPHKNSNNHNTMHINAACIHSTFLQWHAVTRERKLKYSNGGISMRLQ